MANKVSIRALSIADRKRISRESHKNADKHWDGKPSDVRYEVIVNGKVKTRWSSREAAKKSAARHLLT